MHKSQTIQLDFTKCKLHIATAAIAVGCVYRLKLEIRNATQRDIEK